DAQCSPQHGRVRPSAGGQPVRRRDFITLVGGVTAGWPLAARAQQPTMPVIGFLSVGTAETMSDYVAAFHRGLADGGFVEGRDVVIEYRWSEGHNEGSLHWPMIWFAGRWQSSVRSARQLRWLLRRRPRQSRSFFMSVPTPSELVSSRA